MVLRSPLSDVDIPEVSLPEFVFAEAGRWADKAALIDGPSGRTLTYQQLAGGVDAFAAGLAARGFAPGEIMGIFSPNIPEYALAFHGVARAGGAATTINPLSSVDEVARQLSAAEARFLLTVPPFAETAAEAATKAGVEEVFVVGEAEGLTPLNALLGDPADAPDVVTDPVNDLVALPFSSGTTGLPKGVMLTHRNLVANVIQSNALLDVTSDDIVIGVLPFYHIYGLTVILNIALANGCTVVTMPRFDMQQFLELHQTHGITRGYLVPPIILGLAKHPVVDQYDLSALKNILSGAAPLSAEVGEAAAERIGCVVMQGYGLTETSPVTHVTPPERNKPGRIGVLVPSTEALLVDVDTGEPVATGERGELWVRGPQVMRGYLNDPAATSGMIDDDGWLHTGDVGTVDDEGYFAIVDRLKELIKYKGYQVAPAELEALLLDHEQISDAAVIGRADEEAGEIPVAYVVAEELGADHVMQYVADRVAPQKRIREVHFVEEIPKSASGKIMRRLLRSGEQ